MTANNPAKRMNSRQVETFIMMNERNWNPLGSLMSHGEMRNPEIWQTWKKTRQDPRYKPYIRATVNRNIKSNQKTPRQPVASVPAE